MLFLPEAGCIDLHRGRLQERTCVQEARCRPGIRQEPGGKTRRGLQHSLLLHHSNLRFWKRHYSILHLGITSCHYAKQVSLGNWTCQMKRICSTHHVTFAQGVDIQECIAIISSENVKTMNLSVVYSLTFCRFRQPCEKESRLWTWRAQKLATRFPYPLVVAEKGHFNLPNDFAENAVLSQMLGGHVGSFRKDKARVKLPRERDKEIGLKFYATPCATAKRSIKQKHNRFINIELHTMLERNVQLTILRARRC